MKMERGRVITVTTIMISLIMETLLHCLNFEHFQYTNAGLKRSMTIQQLESYQAFHLHQPFLVMCCGTAFYCIFTVFTAVIQVLSFAKSPSVNNLFLIVCFCNPIFSLLMGYSLSFANYETFFASLIILCCTSCIPTLLWTGNEGGTVRTTQRMLSVHSLIPPSFSFRCLGFL